MVFPTPGGPERSAHLAQAPLSWAAPHGGGFEPFLPVALFRLLEFQSRNQIFNLFMFDLSPCWPITFLLAKGRYFSTQSSVAPSSPLDAETESICRAFSGEMCFETNFKLTPSLLGSALVTFGMLYFASLVSAFSCRVVLPQNFAKTKQETTLGIAPG